MREKAQIERKIYRKEERNIKEKKPKTIEKQMIYTKKIDVYECNLKRKKSRIAKITANNLDGSFQKIGQLGDESHREKQIE